MRKLTRWNCRRRGRRCKGNCRFLSRVSSYVVRKNFNQRNWLVRGDCSERLMASFFSSWNNRVQTWSLIHAEFDSQMLQYFFRLWHMKHRILFLEISARTDVRFIWLLRTPYACIGIRTNNGLYPCYYSLLYLIISLLGFSFRQITWFINFRILA
jgi:hypothetical protein